MDAQRLLDRTVRQTVKEEDGQLLVNTYQDVEPHLKYAAACRRVDAEVRGRFGRRGDLRRTMSVPTNIIYAAAQKLGIARSRIFDSDCQKRIWKELKDPLFKGFRTTIDRRI